MLTSANRIIETPQIFIINAIYIPSERGHSKMTSRTQRGVGVSEIVTKRDRISRGGVRYHTFDVTHLKKVHFYIILKGCRLHADFF